jgi:hypothetical protein
MVRDARKSALLTMRIEGNKVEWDHLPPGSRRVLVSPINRL